MRKGGVKDPEARRIQYAAIRPHTGDPLEELVKRAIGVPKDRIAALPGFFHAKLSTLDAKIKDLKLEALLPRQPTKTDFLFLLASQKDQQVADPLATDEPAKADLDSVPVSIGRRDAEPVEDAKPLDRDAEITLLSAKGYLPKKLTEKPKEKKVSRFASKGAEDFAEANGLTVPDGFKGTAANDKISVKDLKALAEGPKTAKVADPPKSPEVADPPKDKIKEKQKKQEDKKVPKAITKKQSTNASKEACLDSVPVSIGRRDAGPVEAATLALADKLLAEKEAERGAAGLRVLFVSGRKDAFMSFAQLEGAVGFLGRKKSATFELEDMNKQQKDAATKAATLVLADKPLAEKEAERGAVGFPGREKSVTFEQEDMNKQQKDAATKVLIHIKKLQEDIKKQQKDAATIQGKLTDVTTEKDKLQDELAKVTGQKEDLQGQVTALTGDKEELQGHLTNVLYKHAIEAARLKDEKNTLQCQLANVAEEKVNLQSQLASLMGEKEGLPGQLTDVTEKDELQGQLKALTEQKEELQGQVTVLTGQKEKLQEDMKKQQQDAAAKAEELDRALLRAKEAEREVADLQKELKAAAPAGADRALPVGMASATATPKPSAPEDTGGLRRSARLAGRSPACQY